MFLFVIVYMTFAPYSEEYYILRTSIGGLLMENNKRMKVIVTPFNILEKLFEKQAHVRTTKDFWNFAEEDLLKGLYWEELYNKVGICTLVMPHHLRCLRVAARQTSSARAQTCWPPSPAPWLPPTGDQSDVRIVMVRSNQKPVLSHLNN